MCPLNDNRLRGNSLYPRKTTTRICDPTCVARKPHTYMYTSIHNTPRAAIARGASLAQPSARASHSRKLLGAARTRLRVVYRKCVTMCARSLLIPHHHHHRLASNSCDGARASRFGWNRRAQLSVGCVMSESWCARLAFWRKSSNLILFGLFGCLEAI